MDKRTEAEIARCRSIASHLPDQLFKLVPIELGSAILGEFLRTGFVTARSHSPSPARKHLSTKSRTKTPRRVTSRQAAHQSQAVEDAASAASIFACGGQDVSSGRPNRSNAPYRTWTWSWNIWDELEGDQEARVALFLNAIAEQAFKAVSDLHRDEELRSPAPLCLFSTAVDRDSPLPLSRPGQDAELRPGLLLLPTAAFMTLPPQHQERNHSPTSEAVSTNEIGGHDENTSRSTLFPPPPPSATHAPESSCSSEGTTVDLPHPSRTNATTKCTLENRERHSNSPSSLLSSPRHTEASLAKRLRQQFAHWQQVRAVGDVHSSDMAQAVLKLHLNMRALRRAQPWLRFALGLAFTGSAHNDLNVTLVRAIPSGVEECALCLAESRGALNIIRIVLGLVLFQDTEFGVDPWFELAERDSSLEGNEEGLLCSGAAYDMRKMREARGVVYRQRSVQRIWVTPDNTAYCSVSQLLFSRVQFSGRGTRVWAVKWERTDDLWRRLFTHGANPELLVIKASAQTVTQASREELVIEHAIGQVATSDSSQYVVLPIKQWLSEVKEDTCHRAVVNAYKFAPAPDPKAEKRVLQYTLMPLKRPMWKFTSLSEAVGAIVDAMKGHEFLCSIGILHRDISEDNIVLAYLPGLEVARGYLIDLDMATFSSLSGKGQSEIEGGCDCIQSECVCNQGGCGCSQDKCDCSQDGCHCDQDKCNCDQDGCHTQIGTSLWMAADILEAKAVHAPEHDLQSFFYVLYLLLLTYNGPWTPTKLDSEHERPWPADIDKWHKGTLMERGWAKRGIMLNKHLLLLQISDYNHATYFLRKTNPVRYQVVEELITLCWEQIMDSKANFQVFKENTKHADLYHAMEAWLRKHPDL